MQTNTLVHFAGWICHHYRIKLNSIDPCGDTGLLVDNHRIQQQLQYTQARIKQNISQDPRPCSFTSQIMISSVMIPPCENVLRRGFKRRLTAKMVET